MNIIEKQISEITPYENNPRNNDDAVKYVANSIKEFGFKVPIVIDSDGVIVCGHTRYKACQALGITKVPCVVADDLTDAQIKAFRLADNKVAEQAKWNDDLLSVELDALNDIDMADFGFLEDADINNNSNELDERYSASAGEVIYEPKNTSHKISDLYEIDDRADYYIEQIKNPEIRKFCELRKASLIKFNFPKIADYYAYQATEDEQRAFEALALVLLDKDKMIENGYLDLMESALSMGEDDGSD